MRTEKVGVVPYLQLPGRLRPSAGSLWKSCRGGCNHPVALRLWPLHGGKMKSYFIHVLAAAVIGLAWRTKERLGW